MSEDPLDQPATKRDLKELDDRMTGQMHSLEERMTGQMHSLEERMTGQMHSLEERVTGQMRNLEERMTEQMHSLEERVVEHMRDMQTEILRGFEAFASGFTIRLRKVEGDQSNTDAALSARVEIVEKRLFELEKKILESR